MFRDKLREVFVAMVPVARPPLFRPPILQAFVGFTAGTGRAWAKHDVLAWYWCHNDGGGT